MTLKTPTSPDTLASLPAHVLLTLMKARYEQAGARHAEYARATDKQTWDHGQCEYGGPRHTAYTTMLWEQQERNRREGDAYLAELLRRARMEGPDALEPTLARIIVGVPS